jgi:hypothetical protein
VIDAGDPQLNIFLSLRRAAEGAKRQTCSHKVEFSFLKGNLMAPASQLFTFSRGTFPTMEEHMLGESTQILLFLAIVGLTVVSTIDLVMQPIKQEQDIDKKH